MSQTNTITNNAKDISIICSTLIKNEIKALSSIVSEINSMLSPILYSADGIQKRGDIDRLTKVKISDQGCWNTFLYVNVRTELLHTDDNCAYAYITAPKQSR